jgi:glycosyltransferase involved in cell wall biosynthesis
MLRLEGYRRTATRLFLAIERGLARVTDRIVAISSRISTELLEEQHIGRADQYRVVPLGFDLKGLAAIDEAARANARALLQIPAGAAVITTVGRLSAIKQQRLFLETAQLIGQGRPSVVFLIVGDGDLSGRARDRRRGAGLADRVRFLGWRRDLETIYGATDVFLLVAQRGTPVALIESMAAGCSGVSTDVGGVRDVLESDAVGLLAADGDAPALARQVTTLLADTDRRRRMGAAGRALVLARYGLDRLVADVEALYRELVH